MGTINLYSGLIGSANYILTGIWDRTIILASLPIGLKVVTIIFSKHTDKLREDKVKQLSNLRASKPPPGDPIWPRWFSTVCFLHNHAFSNYFVVALMIEPVIRTLFPNFRR